MARLLSEVHRGRDIQILLMLDAWKGPSLRAMRVKMGLRKNLLECCSVCSLLYYFYPSCSFYRSWVPSLRAHVSLFVCSSMCSHHSRHSYARKSDSPSCLLSLPLGLFLSPPVEFDLSELLVFFCSQHSHYCAANSAFGPPGGTSPLHCLGLTSPFTLLSYSLVLWSIHIIACVRLYLLLLYHARHSHSYDSVMCLIHCPLCCTLFPLSLIIAHVSPVGPPLMPVLNT